MLHIALYNCPYVVLVNDLNEKSLVTDECGVSVDLAVPIFPFVVKG